MDRAVTIAVNAKAAAGGKLKDFRAYLDAKGELPVRPETSLTPARASQRAHHKSAAALHQLFSLDLPRSPVLFSRILPFSQRPPLHRLAPLPDAKKSQSKTIRAGLDQPRFDAPCACAGDCGAAGRSGVVRIHVPHHRLREEHDEV